MGKQYYRLCLEEYSTPAFTSFGKYYFGTLEMIDEFIQTLKEDEDWSRSFHRLISAYEKFCEGDRKVTHIVAFQEVPFLVPAKLLGEDFSVQEEIEWEHLNTWRWIYDMKCNKAESEHIWFSCRGEYFRCIKTSFTDLQYKNTLGDYTPIHERFWGHPGVLKPNMTNVESRFFVIEKTFKNKVQTLEDMNTFRNEKKPNFTGIINDIFGDG